MIEEPLSAERSDTGDQLRQGGCGAPSCRCGPKASAACVGLLFAVACACVLTTHNLAVVTQQEQHGRCLNDPVVVHTVRPGENCSFLARQYGVPMFDLVDQKKRKSCCDDSSAMEAGDTVGLCPNLRRVQWKSRPPPKKVIMTYIGAAPAGFRAPMQLPASVNVAALAFAQDVDGLGTFEMEPQFTEDQSCSAQVNPATATRGFGNSPSASRRWLLSIHPKDGNQWPRTSAEKWGASGAETLERLILRYRLDGIDVNYEDAGAYIEVFTGCMCELFTQLERRLPGILVTVSPYGNRHSPQTVPLYQQLMSRCGEKVTWLNYQNYANQYNDASQNVQAIEYVGKMYGWNKLVWGVGVNGGGVKEDWYPYGAGHETGAPAVAVARGLLASHPGIRGVFSWAAELSAQRCQPAWCVEDSLAMAMGFRDVPSYHGPCKYDKELEQKGFGVCARRPTVGATVKSVAKGHHFNEVGVISGDDHDGKPYRIRFGKVVDTRYYYRTTEVQCRGGAKNIVCCTSCGGCFSGCPAVTCACRNSGCPGIECDGSC